jgi:flagellar biosynthesis/type III secretory pathway chaperone
MPTLSTEHLFELIHRKRQVLTQLREVGQRQSELIASGDVTTLLTLLAAKQRLLAALQLTEGQLAPYRDEDPAARVWSSPARRSECATESADCRQLLAEVVQLERECEAAMLAHRDATAAQLQQAHPARAAAGAYAQNRRPALPLSALPEFPGVLSGGLNLVSD